MAMYVEPKTQIPGAKPRKPPNPTLENVAEEVLNGMFCHYEPPDANRRGKGGDNKNRGILRQPNKNNHKQRQQGAARQQRVRWEDEKEPTPKHADAAASLKDLVDDPGCSIRQVCLDASVEAGCVPDPDGRKPNSSNASSEAASFNDQKKTKQMDAQEAIAVAKAKSPRNNRKEDDSA